MFGISLVLFFASAIFVVWLKQKQKSQTLINIAKGVMSALGMLTVVTFVLWLVEMVQKGWFILTHI